MPNVHVLVVDDDPDVRQVVGDILSREGAQVSLAPDGRRCLELLEQAPFQVMFTDLRMPGMHGLVVLQQAIRLRPLLAAIVFTGYATLESCVEAMRIGACDYVAKPFSPETIRAAMARALDRHGPHRGNELEVGAGDPAAAGLRRELGDPADEAAAQSPAMRDILNLVAKIAPTDAPVLIRGEIGVGKEWVARAIHRRSRRADCPFVRVACGAIRETELDQRLFGRERGGPEGDYQGGTGLLERAHGGTLFLDDVHLLPGWAQIKLFDAIREGCYQCFDSRGTLPLDVRVIAATPCDLEAAVAENRFQSSLHYYLTVVTIHIPPLRERREDVKVLAARCLARATREPAFNPSGIPYRFSTEAWECLLGYDWPGNMRELASVIAHAVLLSDSDQIKKAVIAAALPKLRQQHGCDMISVPLAGHLSEIERYVIEEVIRRCRGNKAAAARSLGLHRRTLYRLLEGEPREE